MEINKQLFEDVLSGKLEGAFVLKNKQTVKSNTLKRSSIDNFPYKILIDYGNGVTDYGMYKSNGDFESYSTSYFDIIDFIPETNMKENELTIEIPEGKIVDWDESKKQNKIVLKDKQLTYGDICEKLFKNCLYFINERGKIELNDNVNKWMKYDANNADSKHQLECILAKNKLANVAKYLNGEWEPYKTDLGHFDAWVLFATPDKDFVGYTKITDCAYNSNVLFRSPELAKQAVKILGEETVKLALEPLGI